MDVIQAGQIADRNASLNRLRSDLPPVHDRRKNDQQDACVHSRLSQHAPSSGIPAPFRATANYAVRLETGTLQPGEEPPRGSRQSRREEHAKHTHAVTGTRGLAPSHAVQSQRWPPMGVSLFHDPEFVYALNSAELSGVFAHEVMHPALRHHIRRGDGDQARWNTACDYKRKPLRMEINRRVPQF
jgi:hypothetical protein